jgi:hypothetical protein
LKRSYDQTPWSFEDARRHKQNTKRQDTGALDENVVIQLRPIATGYELEPQIGETHGLEEEQLQLDQGLEVPGNVETPDADSNRMRQTPESSVQDPDYEYPNSPRSRRELATTPVASPVTRSHARLQLQENPPV